MQLITVFYQFKQQRTSVNENRFNFTVCVKNVMNLFEEIILGHKILLTH